MKIFSTRMMGPPSAARPISIAPRGASAILSWARFGVGPNFVDAPCEVGVSFQRFPDARCNPGHGDIVMCGADPAGRDDPGHPSLAGGHLFADDRNLIRHHGDTPQIDAEHVQVARKPGGVPVDRFARQDFVADDDNGAVGVSICVGDQRFTQHWAGTEPRTLYILPDRMGSICHRKGRVSFQSRVAAGEDQGGREAQSRGQDIQRGRR